MRPVCARAWAILLPAAALFAGRLGAQPRPERYIREVRFWSLEEVTRVAVETSHEVQYRSERLADPDRLVFDFEDIRPRPGLRGIQIMAVGDRLLRQIRMAETQPGVTRVVLDLAAPAEFAVSQLTNPDRLIIELRAARPPEQRQAPAPSAAPCLDHTGKNACATEQRQTPAPSAPPCPDHTGKNACATEQRPAPATAPVKDTPAPPPGRPSPPAAKPAVAGPQNPPLSAAAAKRDSRGDRSLIRALGLKLERVVLDPGHGGADTGTISPLGLTEKELVLDIAKRLGALISERLGSQVIYTRSEDAFVPLEARTELANQHKADLFVSLHANSSRLRWIAGSETYYLDFTTSASALEVAARENAASEKSIHELQELVQKIALRTKVQESREFAVTVQRALYNDLWKGRTVKDRGAKKAPFVVLIGAAMPCVLVEMDFLSNARAEKLLKTPEHRQRVAEALYRGLAQYASTLSHFEVARTKSGP